MYLVSRISGWGRTAALSLGLLGLLTGCKNLYADFGDRSSDDYLIEQTRLYMDRFQFDSALGAILPVLGTQPANPEVVYLASASYAGRAGLRILDLFSALGSEAADKGLIQIFAEHFGGADDDDIADIDLAIATIETYQADPALRSARLNFFMTFLLFSRIGVINARYALDANGDLNAGFTPCKKGVNAAGATGLPNASVDAILGAFGKLPAAIANAGSDSFGDFSDDFTVPSPAATCVAVQGSVECLAMRTLIGVGPDDGGIGFDILVTPCLAVAP